MTTFPKWLREWGACVQCRARSDGELLDNRNGTLGPYCRKCAAKRIAEGAKQ